MRSAVNAARSSWWAQALQNRLIALVLAMVVIVPLVATPADPSVAGIATMAVGGFAILLMVALLWRSDLNLSRDRVLTFLRTGANLPVVLLMALAIVSCVMSQHKAFSVQETFKLGAGVLLYFVVAYQFRQSKHLFMLVDTLLFVAIAASLFGMAQYQLNSAGPTTALFGNSQLLGSFLMILLPIVAVVAITEKAPKRQLAAQAATMMTAGCLLMAHTRSAWIGAAAGLAVLGLLAALTAVKKGNWVTEKHKVVLPVMLAVVSIGFFLLVGSQSNTIADRAGTLATASGDTSWQIRQHQWQGSIAMIKESPWTGHGIGTYPVYQQAYTGIGSVISEGGKRASLTEQAHNFYLQTAAELGLPGLLLMVAVLGSFFFAGLKRVDKMDVGIRRTLLMGSMGSMVAFSFDALSSPSWQFAQTSMFMWLMLGIGVSCVRPRVKVEEEAPVVAVSPRLARPLSFATACAALMAVVPTLSMAAAPDGSGYKPGCGIGDKQHRHYGQPGKGCTATAPCDCAKPQKAKITKKSSQPKVHKTRQDFINDFTVTVTFSDGVVVDVTRNPRTTYRENSKWAIVTYAGATNTVTANTLK